MANKRKAIIEAAITRISEQGDNFSTGQVASDVGCSQSLVFRYFVTKEGLMSACFDQVCHELMQTLRDVTVPKVTDAESVRYFMIDVWRAYCGYLESNSHVAKAYMFFVSRGRRLPNGYSRTEDVLRRILGNAYGPVSSHYPDFGFVAGYLIMSSYVVAAGLFSDHPETAAETAEKVERILKYGIFGYHTDAE